MATRRRELSGPGAAPTVTKSSVPAIVLGYGSIGRRHARALGGLTSRLAIVNRRETVRVEAREAHPAAQVVERLEALDGAGFPWPEATAVIATWGPSHAALFHALVDRGVRRVLCEKPMAASVHDAWAMARRAEQGDMFLGLSHTLRYAGLVPALTALATAHGLGAPVSVVVEGGAACLLTNGIHWIDFASELFGGPPERVVSTAVGEALNPRSQELALYGGSAIWSFGGGREAVISFNNGSSLFPHGRVHYRDAVIRVGYVPTESDAYLKVTLSGRDREAVARHPAVSRTGPPTVQLWNGELPGTVRFNEGLRLAAYELLHGSAPKCGARHGIDSVSSCIGALVASREHQAIDLPVDPTSAFGMEHWPIS